MSSPTPYFDEDRPPRGSPKLYGEMTGLRGVPTSALRGDPKPTLTTRQRRIRRKHLIIFLARVNGLSLSFIADAFDLSPPEILRVCRKMGYDEE